MLMENYPARERFACEHGLSIYVETQKHRILFDAGRTDKFLENACALGVDVRQVDAVVLSHAHNDHGGGLPAFLRVNNSAKVYLRQGALEGHYAARPNGEIEEIGLPHELEKCERLVWTDELFKIDEELTLFSGITGRKYFSSANLSLLTDGPCGMVQDSFSHEQCLVVSEGDKRVLITGCAHNGIVNTLSRYQDIFPQPADVVIGGFHLSNPGAGVSEPDALIDGVAHGLSDYPARYYTGHCTGLPAYKRLKAALGSRITYLSAGSELTI